MTTKSSKLKDFDPEELLASSKSHTERIEVLEDRVEALEKNISDDAWFAKRFVDSQKDHKQVDESIKSIIKDYDNHKLKIGGLALAKWLGVLVIGGILGALIKGYIDK